MKIVETEQELRACYPVMKELRPHLVSAEAHRSRRWGARFYFREGLLPGALRFGKALT